jgi:regulator of sigma E protease
LIAGPAMNVVLAVAVMSVVLYQGVQVPVYQEQPPVVGVVAEDSPAAEAGILPGDRILTVAGQEVDSWEDLSLAVGSKAEREIDVVLRRESGMETVRVTPVGLTEFNYGDLGVGPQVSPQVAGLGPSPTVARDAGIQIGDVIEAVDGQEVTLQSLIDTINTSAGASLTLTVRRDGVARDIDLAAQSVGDAWRIGVSLMPESRVIEPGPFEALTMSVEQNYEWVRLIVQTLWGLVKGEIPTSQLVGPVGIAQLSGSAANTGWVALFTLMAMISINLGILNLLPIPVLDGGHIFVMGLEGIARRDFSVQLKERIMLAGFVVIMTLMVTVIYNDLTRVAWIERLMIWR